MDKVTHEAPLVQWTSQAILNVAAVRGLLERWVRPRAEMMG